MSRDATISEADLKRLPKKVPFTKEGLLFKHPDVAGDEVWEDNVPFECFFRVVGMKGSRFELETRSGEKFPMLPQDFLEMLEAGVVIEDNEFSAVWKIRKRGLCYGVRFIAHEWMPVHNMKYDGRYD